LGIQYARQMGFRTIAIGRGRDKEALAKRLGAHAYIDNSSVSPAEALRQLGGAKVILATAPNSKSMSDMGDGLAPSAKLLIMGGRQEGLGINPVQLMFGGREVRGWPAGTAKDSEDTLQVTMLTGVRPMIEKYPLEKAAEGYQQMMSGKARFRVVLTMN